MSRIIAVVGMLVALACCGAAAWLVARPPIELFVVSDAQAIGVNAEKWGEWQISYYAPGAPATWHITVAQRLEAARWRSPDSAGYGALTRSYGRATSLGLCELREWAYLSFDPLRPHLAQIKVRRWIALPWWHHFAPRGVV